MTGWEPATKAEVAMQDALRAQDQQLYFRILTRVDLLLPVAGQAPQGWGTWTTGGRTHVLAFTSVTAMRACLGQNAGATRRIPYAELAAGWPNHEWWLAVNPGLPIEGYLPAWFVAQLSRGDVRLPGRTMGARARLERVENAARARAGADAPGWDAPPAAVSGWSGPTTPGGPTRRTGEVAPPAERTVPEPEPAPDNLAGWVSDLRRHPDEPKPFDGAGRPGTTSSRSAVPPPPPARSFFEPSSGRAARRPSPLDQPQRTGERVVPPSRFARGGQPFPRRRPLNEPVPEDPTRTFCVDAAESTQVPGPGRPEEPPRPFRPAPPPAFAVEAAQALPRRRPRPAPDLRRGGDPGPVPSPNPAGDLAFAAPPDGDERTQPILAGDPAFVFPTEAEELPPSIAEPVSGPPAGRRGFSPIVIEGTIIESRDLTEPEPSGASGEEPLGRTGAGAAPRVEPASEVPPPDSPRGAPVGSFFEPVALPAEATVPLFGGSLFEPAAPVAGQTERLFAPATPVEERTVSLFEHVGPVVERTEPPSGPAASAQQRREPTDGTEEPTPTGAAGGTPTAGPTSPDVPPSVPADFVPTNDVEKELLGAAGDGNTDGFLSTLLLARVLLPVAADSAAGSRPGDSGFVWHTEQLDGETYVVVYTSPERLADRAEGPVDTVRVKFVQLIRRWPDVSWSFAVNPGTPVGATYPGEQVLALANWAAEVGLGDDPESEPEPPTAGATAAAQSRPVPPPVDPTRPVTMQKVIAPSQLAYYLERGYDRVSGFVHRANELAHLSTPAELYDALGLGHPDSPFSRDAEEIYVLRWPAYRPSLYRIPYGGQNEVAMRAMEGWVIERPPFRGNGFAPGESSDVVAEFKVDSARLPHGAQLWRIGADRTERMVATLDTDALLWQQVETS